MACLGLVTYERACGVAPQPSLVRRTVAINERVENDLAEKKR